MRHRRPPRPVPSIGAGTWAAAGNRFTKLRVVPPLPIGAYRNKISGVPLTGGQAQGFIPGYPSVTGSAAAPLAFGIITPVTFTTTGGSIAVNWTVTLSGTLSGVDANNFFLFQNNSLVAVSVNPAAPGTYPQAPAVLTLSPGDDLIILAGNNNATAGSVYGGTIAGFSRPLTLSAGPQGLGGTWYPAQITLSTTTGALDTSTALVYLGNGGVPTMQVASVFSGNGTAALAVPPLQPGELIIVTWTNGHGGDTAAFNILGTMDALTTGRG